MLEGQEIVVKLNDTYFTDYVTDISISAAMDQVARTLKMSLTVSELGYIIRLKASDIVTVYIGGILVFKGYCDSFDIAYGDNGTQVSIQCRNLIGDMLDSTLNTSIEFKGGVSLQNVIDRLSGFAKLHNLKIINLTNNKRTVSADENFKGLPSDNLFEFFDRVLRRFYVLMSSDASGNILLLDADTKSKPKLQLINKMGSANNNFTSMSYSCDNHERYNKYVVHGKTSLLKPGKRKAHYVKDEFGVGVAYDHDIRTSRVIDIKVETNTADKHLLNKRAQWEASCRKARAIKYSCTTYGFKNNNQLYNFNTMVSVDDEVSGLKTNLLITGFTYNYNGQAGSSTSLELSLPDAFSLDPIDFGAPGVAGKVKSPTPPTRKTPKTPRFKANDPPPGEVTRRAEAYVQGNK